MMSCSPGLRRRLRIVLLASLTMPLFQTGTCVEMLQRIVINSIFDATTPLLDEVVQQRLNEIYGLSDSP